MNKYKHGLLYIGDIKINNQIVKKDKMIIYDPQKDIFYGIEVLNELIDIELNKEIPSSVKKSIEEKIKKNTFAHDIERNDNVPYIDENSIQEFFHDNKHKKSK